MERKNMRRAMPIGVDDFSELITKNYCFVDKTRFIKEILEGHSKVTLITRPRRFGKTLNLSMLRYFFSIENGEKNRELFAGLDIQRAGERYMAQQGSRPVVFLSLKDVQARDFAGLLEKMAELMGQIYGREGYLQNSDALSPQEKKYFVAVLDEACTPGKLQSALANLIKNLRKHYGQKPVLLLDEYDAPIICAWERGYYDECIDFMRGFLSEALKTNEALDFAVLTGVTRVSKESIFSGLNNLRVCSVLSERYSDIFGFTQEEADRLLSMCGLEARSADLKKWYDGYLFGSTEIYNPWSVISFIDNDCKFQPYWLNTSGNSILKALLARIDARKEADLLGLLRGKTLSTPIRENIVYADLNSDRSTLYMMLLTAGYLKAVKTWKDEYYEDWAALQIPNLEIRRAYSLEVMENIVPHQGQIVLMDMMEAMTEGRGEDFAQYLAELLRDFVSFHDSSHNPESFYHGLLLGLSVWLEGRYRVKSNRESGYGRFDIAFFPAKENLPGVILELKTVKEEGGLEEAAQGALAQIEAKAYPAELSRQGVRSVWRYGIAFCGKKMWLAQE
ncbi:AAA family ATPase [uncultured Anaerovibrio sp.]|uniref:AAA family ATPase n=1 Tax=uncultured Anaerovibrio sp. TaxID=361586 RepID=UPI00262205A0|nr:AAA family ATPase [uncultured Anaerovibrio sp.]